MVAAGAALYAVEARGPERLGFTARWSFSATGRTDSAEAGLLAARDAEAAPHEGDLALVGWGFVLVLGLSLAAFLIARGPGPSWPRLGALGLAAGGLFVFRAGVLAEGVAGIPLRSEYARVTHGLTPVAWTLLAAWVALGVSEFVVLAPRPVAPPVDPE